VTVQSELAMRNGNVQKYIANKNIVKNVDIRGKVVTFVAKQLKQGDASFIMGSNDARLPRS
jgi:hypothetical protein